MRLAVRGVETVEGGHQVTFLETFEPEGATRPVVVAEFIARIYP